MGLVDRVRHRIEGVVQRKFGAAIPEYSGDRLLVTLLGRILSQPSLARRAYGVREIFLIKGALFLRGVRLDDTAYQGVGTQWKEDLGQRHYDPDAGVEKDRVAPHALYLPHGLYVPLYLDRASPLLLRREGGVLYLYLEELRLFHVELEKRPAYYSKSRLPSTWRSGMRGCGLASSRAEALEHAVRVFGRGNVASVLVAGMEPKGSFLAGVEWMAQRGIHGVPIPWAPAPGSALTRWNCSGNELPALEKLMVGWLDRCSAMRIDFTPEVTRPEKPHRELKWEIPDKRRSICSTYYWLLALFWASCGCSV